MTLPPPPHSSGDRLPTWPNHALLAHPLLFARSDLDAYENEILGNSRATEADASRFFERFPKFLFLGQGNRVMRELVLFGADDAPRFRVDFFRNRFGSPYWDIIELKSPKSSFVVGDRLHSALGGKVHQAIAQAEDYRDFLLKDDSAKNRLRERGINVAQPRLLVVVGRVGSSVSRDKVELLKDRARRGPLEAWSYTDLMEFAKDHYHATSSLVLPINWHRPVLASDFTEARLSLLDYPSRLDAFEDITLEMVDELEDKLSQSRTTGVPNMRRLLLGAKRASLYFYYGATADLRMVFARHLILPAVSGEHTTLVLGLRREAATRRKSTLITM